MSFFMPDGTYRAYFDLKPSFLKEQGIKVLLLDIDNTLAPYEQPLPDDRLKAWLCALQAAGITPAFLSNNQKDRVELFNSSLGLSLCYDAHKPLTRRARALFRSLGGDKKTTAFMGDQIFTDICCGHRCGAKAFLVPPIKDKTDKGTRFKRWLEKRILRRYYKKHPNAPDIREGSTIIFCEESSQ